MSFTNGVSTKLFLLLVVRNNLLECQLENSFSTNKLVEKIVYKDIHVGNQVAIHQIVKRSLNETASTSSFSTSSCEKTCIIISVSCAIAILLLCLLGTLYYATCKYTDAHFHDNWAGKSLSQRRTPHFQPSLSYLDEKIDQIGKIQPRSIEWASLPDISSDYGNSRFYLNHHALENDIHSEPISPDRVQQLRNNDFTFNSINYVEHDRIRPHIMTLHNDFPEHRRTMSHSDNLILKNKNTITYGPPHFLSSERLNNLRRMEYLDDDKERSVDSDYSTANNSIQNSTYSSGNHSTYNGVNNIDSTYEYDAKNNSRPIHDNSIRQSIDYHLKSNNTFVQMETTFNENRNQTKDISDLSDHGTKDINSGLTNQVAYM